MDVPAQSVIWTPNPGPQTEALKRTEFEILYGGARGGGKTDAGIAWLLRHADNPLYRALVIRRNAEDLSDWISRAKVMYRETGAVFVGKPAEIRFPSGATIRTGHLKDADAYTKYQGHEYQRMLIEELNQIPQERMYEQLIASCRSTSAIRPQVFATTNPGGVGHVWIKRRFVDICPPGEVYYQETEVDGQRILTSRIFIQATIDDNPIIKERDPRYIAFLESFKNTNPALYRAWRHGDWDIVAGQVFSEWNRETHVVEPFKIPREWYRYIGMDWGVNDPTAICWFAVSPEGRTYLYREFYMNGMDFQNNVGMPLTPSRLSKFIQAIHLKEKEDYTYAVCDPSMWNKLVSGKTQDSFSPEGQSIAETMMMTGMRMVKADNDRINGLDRVREMLALAPDGKPHLQVFSTCTEVIRTVPTLSYDAHRIEDVDTDGEDHLYDAIRYFCMSRPAKPIFSEQDFGDAPIREHLQSLLNMEKYRGDEEFSEWGEL